MQICSEKIPLKTSEEFLRDYCFQSMLYKYQFSLCFNQLKHELHTRIKYYETTAIQNKTRSSLNEKENKN